MNIKIKNFRSVKEIDIESNKNILTLVGANESGKTNILESINHIGNNSHFKVDDYASDLKSEQNKEISISLNLEIKTKIFYEERENFLLKYRGGNSNSKSYKHIEKMKNIEVVTYSEKKSSNIYNSQNLNNPFLKDKNLLFKIIVEEFKDEFSLTNTYLQDEFTLDYRYRFNFMLEKIKMNQRLIKGNFEFFIDILDFLYSMHSFSLPKLTIINIGDLNLFEEVQFEISWLETEDEKYARSKMRFEIWLKYLNINKDDLLNVYKHNKLEDIKQVKKAIDQINKNTKKIFNDIKEQYGFISPYFQATIIGNNIFEIELIDENANNKTSWIDNLKPKNRSGGFKTFYIILFQILSIKKNVPVIFLIDEPENHLNPFLQAKLLDFLIMRSSDNTKFIFSTHSPYMIDFNGNSNNYFIHRSSENNETLLKSEFNNFQKGENTERNEYLLEMLFKDEFTEIKDIMNIAMTKKDKFLLVEGPTDKIILNEIFNKNKILNILVISVNGHIVQKTFPIIDAYIKDKNKLFLLVDKDWGGKEIIKHIGNQIAPENIFDYSDLIEETTDSNCTLEKFCSNTGKFNIRTASKFNISKILPKYIRALKNKMKIDN